MLFFSLTDVTNSLLILNYWKLLIKRTYRLFEFINLIINRLIIIVSSIQILKKGYILFNYYF